MKEKNSRIPIALPKDKETRRKLYTEALCNSYRFWCDVLDCSKSLARTDTDRSFSEVLENALSKTRAFWTIIHRAPVGDRDDVYEFGVSTMDTPDYFIWIYVRPDVAEKLLEKYGLGVLPYHESFRDAGRLNSPTRRKKQK